MNQQYFNYITGIIFVVMGVLHFVRSVLGWNVIVQGVAIPVGISVLIFVLLGALAYRAFSLPVSKTHSKEDNSIGSK